MMRSGYHAFDCNPAFDADVRSTPDNTLNLLRTLQRKILTPDGAVVLSTARWRASSPTRALACPGMAGPWSDIDFDVSGQRDDSGVGSWTLAQPAATAPVGEVTRRGAFGTLA